MSHDRSKPHTSIARVQTDDVFVREKSLSKELIGKLSFTEMMVWTILGRVPSEGELASIDACLVALMEHGITPSAIATRMVYSSTPEAMQSGVAAGLLSIGNRFVGTAEGCGELLERIRGAEDGDATCRRLVTEHREARRPVPGFGHPTHKPEDPRTTALLAVAEREGTAGPHVAALLLLSNAVDEALGRHIPINATGAVAAILMDCHVPPSLLRGFLLVSRSAGLVAHIFEEQSDPAMDSIWTEAERTVSYQPKKETK